MTFWIVTSLAWFILGYVTARYGPRHLVRSNRVTTRKWENVLGEVWFPARGKWMLCNVHSPLDPERQFYKVYSVNEVTMYKVAAIDLHTFNEIEHQPAPGMSVVELQDELDRETQKSP